MRSGWWRWLPADVTSAGVMTAVMVVAAAESDDFPARPVDAPVIAAVALVGSWTAAARRVPRTALVGSCASLYVALFFGVPGFSPALALGVPLFAVAWAGYLWWGVTAVVAVLAIGVPFRLLDAGAEPVGQVALATMFDVALLAVLLLLGDSLRSRRALRAEAVGRLRMAEQEHQRRLTAERLRVARDLHDVLSHTIAVVSIQAGVAAESIDSHPVRAKQAVELVRSATRDAMLDLRSTIAVLREDIADETRRGPTPGLAQLPDLVDSVRSDRLTASLSVRGDAGPLRPAVELAIYRIVQESLTNVLRHARATSVAILVERGTDEVRVEVRDDGHVPGQSPTGGPVPGSGLQGMLERVAALGGALSFGPVPDPPRGFVVEARLPTGDAR
ncbi:sensor histidine kinase [Micromonospora sp. DR5-3]|uniref:sensor histidine kinase n=1 Tax=unclassified Micromonospora TaxID=2617518 RepID=UPI0011DB8641|nr:MULTISPECIES: sensor histidine kinase [unclassified Micromonospora]MCW3817433.1 sensor histidine kinase [Micromonospora sp. DR5-3]TYC22892.1 sensor histidine kinase [Micromonospora sp. MP36]